MARIDEILTTFIVLSTIIVHKPKLLKYSLFIRQFLTHAPFLVLLLPIENISKVKYLSGKTNSKMVILLFLYF